MDFCPGAIGIVSINIVDKEVTSNGMRRVITGPLSSRSRAWKDQRGCVCNFSFNFTSLDGIRTKK